MITAWQFFKYRSLPILTRVVKVPGRDVDYCRVLYRSCHWLTWVLVLTYDEMSWHWLTCLWLLIRGLDIDWSAYDCRSWHWLDYSTLHVLTLTRVLVLMIAGLDIDSSTYDWRSGHWLDYSRLQVLTLTRVL